jgi:hypothetical protein
MPGLPVEAGELLSHRLLGTQATFRECQAPAGTVGFLSIIMAAPAIR